MIVVCWHFINVDKLGSFRLILCLIFEIHIILIIIFSLRVLYLIFLTCILFTSFDLVCILLEVELVTPVDDTANGTQKKETTYEGTYHYYHH
jgi:hypothetical protein